MAIQTSRANPWRGRVAGPHIASAPSQRVRASKARAFCKRECDGFANCMVAGARRRASPCRARAGRLGKAGTCLEGNGPAARRGSKKPRPAQDTKAGFHRSTPPVAMDPQGKDASSHRTHPDPRPRRPCTRSNGVSAHGEAILVEIRPARFPTQFQFAEHLERLALTFDRFPRRPGAFAVRPFATGLGPSSRQQRRRGINPLSSARTPSASAPPATMSHDPEFFPPPPKQPLPPAKQPTGPMPDQDQPPGEPHHLPDDPVAVPDEGDLLRWSRRTGAVSGRPRKRVV